VTPHHRDSEQLPACVRLRTFSVCRRCWK